MQLKQKLTFMAFGSILTLAGYLLATLTGDGTAQSETDKATVFDEIVCRKLKIVNADGKTALTLNTDDMGNGKVSINHPTGKTGIEISTLGGSSFIRLMSPLGREAINIYSRHYHGGISIHEDRDLEDGGSRYYVKMSVGGLGGQIVLNSPKGGLLIIPDGDVHTNKFTK